MSVFMLIRSSLLQSILLCFTDWAVYVVLKKGSRRYGFQGYRNFSSLKGLEPERLSFLSCSIQKLLIPWQTLKNCNGSSACWPKALEGSMKSDLTSSTFWGMIWGNSGFIYLFVFVFNFFSPHCVESDTHSVSYGLEELCWFLPVSLSYQVFFSSRITGLLLSGKQNDFLVALCR